MNPPIDPRLLRLHPADNVLTVIATLEVDDRLQFGDLSVTVRARLALGHKIAARPVSAGEKIIKYGAPIGSATEAIAAGEHVHTHNLRSDYLPTFQRGEGAHYDHSA